MSYFHHQSLFLYSDLNLTFIPWYSTIMAPYPVNESLPQQFLTYWPLLIIVFFALRPFYRKYSSPLRHVPGPFLASTTNIWRLAVFLRGRQHHEYYDLHQKYGPLVRLGPDTVILSDPAHFHEYFGMDKSAWWRAFRARLTNADHGNIPEIKGHNIAKRQIAGGYSMSSILKNEQKMDKHVSDLMEQFSEKSGTTFDLAPWTQWAAFDIAMDMAFSNPIGFIESGSDVGGLIHSLHQLLTAAGTIALFPAIVMFFQQPWLFPLIAPRTTDKKGPGALYGLAWGQVQNRFKEKGKVEHSDILQWLIEHEDKDGNRMSQERLEQESTAPVIAGSDTSATVMRSIVLFVSTNPRVLAKLRDEIDSADLQGLLSTPPQYDEIRQHVPYIGSIMREALRLYPVLGSPSPRKVGKEGAHICGYYLPPGTEVGLCQWAIGRSTAIFGPDAQAFRPERWTEEVDPATKKLRETGDVFFGSGAMQCTGKNIATLEVWKITTQLFWQFDVEIVDPITPWQEKDSLAMLIWDFRVKMTLREKHASAEK